MRLFKLTMAVWYEPTWAKFFRKSWRKRGYWLAHQPMQFTLGPIRLDVKLEGKL